MTRFLIFITLVLTIAIGVHWYLWARLVRDTQLPAPWGGLATAALALLAINLPLGLALGRRVPAVRSLLGWPAFLWMGLMFLLLIGLLGADVFRLVAGIARRVSGNAADPARRTALARLAATAVTALAGGAGAIAFRAARGEIGVRRVEVALARLPAAHEGLRIVQITDVHVGPATPALGRAFVETIVARVNGLAPDIVAVTGDLVDGSVAELREAVAPLADLRARHGVYFVTGNHEYFSGAGPWLEELPRLGLRVLRNERVTIGEGADAFELAGVDDPTADRYGGLAGDQAMAHALGGLDPSRELVLLAHQPRSFEAAMRHGVGLQLSGHTHGGQMWPFGAIVKLVQPFVAGLHRRGGSQIYVSRGTGYWGPPMRLGAPPEITEVILRRGSPGGGPAT
jgi:predicted MPP superfamily phosphohydrolase